jgi:hypothetical protein
MQSACASSLPMSYYVFIDRTVSLLQWSYPAVPLLPQQTVIPVAHRMPSLYRPPVDRIYFFWTSQYEVVPRMMMIIVLCHYCFPLLFCTPLQWPGQLISLLSLFLDRLCGTVLSLINAFSIEWIQDPRRAYTVSIQLHEQAMLAP